MVVDRSAIEAGFAFLRQTGPVIGQAVHAELHTDTYDCWRVNRPAGWADSTTVEAQELIASDTGRLYEEGAGGPQVNEVIALESPYRFRTEADAPIEAGHLLVITVNGAHPDIARPRSTHLFRVDVTKPTGRELMNVYLAKLTNTPLPEMP